MIRLIGKLVELTLLACILLALLIVAAPGFLGLIGATLLAYAGYQS